METAIDGFQGPPGHLSDPDRVMATAKHFAGDGLTTYGTGSNDQTTGNYPIDQGVDQVNHATFERLALSPYVPAVRAAPRGRRHAVLLRRGLDRGRGRQPDQHARQPRPDHRLAQGRRWASTGS